MKKNRQADGKALERKPLNSELQKLPYHENIAFQALRTVTHPLP